MTTADKASRFGELHVPGSPVILGNAWDAGSARLLESLGYQAVATTSSGFAATLGRLDGTVTRDEAIEHASVIVAATSLPVSADLENGFGREPEKVARTFELALGAGLAGASIEDYSGDSSEPIIEARLAAERVEAACSIAHGGDVHLFVTARTEIYLYDRPDVEEAVARLESFKEAGADAVFVPGMMDIGEIARTVQVGLPVNVLVRPGGPTVADLAAAGVARISVGGSFAFAAYGAFIEAATGLLAGGELGFLTGASAGARAVRQAFA